jgi:hypothetical protein
MSLKYSIPLLAALTILAAGGTAQAGPGDPRLPTKAQLRACPLFADVDFEAIRARGQFDVPAAPGFEWRTRQDARHAQTRGPYGAFAAPADAKTALRIWAGGSETQEHRTDTSSIVWLGADGIWRVNRVDHSSSRPISPRPPPAPDANGVTPLYVGWTADEEARLRRSAYAGVLEPQRAYAIEAALADPCFRLQPDSMPFEVPVRKGKEPRAPCWGVTGGTLEIAWGDGRRRDVTELCGGFYANGIISAVMYARPFIEDAETRAFCDPLRSAAGRGSLSPAERRELAFCEAGLTATLRRKGLDDARRDALFRDAAALPPERLSDLYTFLSAWDAGALKRAIAARAAPAA